MAQTPLTVRKDVVEATRQLALLCRMHVPLSEGLERMAKEPGASPWLKRIGEKVAEGDTLSGAVRRHPNVFSPFYSALVEAAEAAEKPAGILTSLSHWLESAERAAAEVRTTLFYPLLVINVLVLELLFILTVTVPNVLLPLSEAFDIPSAMLHLLVDTPVVPVVLLVSVLALDVVAMLPQATLLLPRLPIVGPLMRTASQALWARAMGTLVGARIDLPRALKLSRHVVLDPALIPPLGAVEEGVRKGDALSDALVSQKFFEPRLAWSTAVGEKTEDMAPLLLDAADALDEQVKRRLQHAIRMLEPWALLAAGIMVLLGLLAYWWPFYSLVHAIH